MPFSDYKVALVTGASAGMGEAIVERLCQEGIEVHAVARRHEQLAARADRTGCIPLAVDVGDLSALTALCQGLQVDILVNNAGIIKRIPILDMPIDDFRQVIEIDLVAPLIVAKRVVPAMIKNGGGKIINMCSMMSIYGRNSVSAYAAAKGGLKLLTANMCCEWAKYNIQINGIGPGYIATSQTEAIRVNGHPFNNLVMTRTPAGRWGDPEDLAGAAIFLSSQASNYVNGHILFVDGGILANFGYVEGENVLPE